MFAPGNASKPFVWQSKARKHVKINRNYIDDGHVASCSPLAVGTSDFLTCCALTAPQTTPVQRQSSGNGHPNSQWLRLDRNLATSCYSYDHKCCVQGATCQDKNDADFQKVEVGGPGTKFGSRHVYTLRM